MYKINTNEPFWWALFLAGAGMIGLFLPILIVGFGIALPLGLLPVEPVGAPRLAYLLAQPLVRLFLFVVGSLTFFHWAHRFRYLLFDLGIRSGRGAVAILCYGTAILGTAYAAMTAFTLV